MKRTRILLLSFCLVSFAAAIPAIAFAPRQVSVTTESGTATILTVSGDGLTGTMYDSYRKITIYFYFSTPIEGRVGDEYYYTGLRQISTAEGPRYIVTDNS